MKICKRVQFIALAVIIFMLSFANLGYAIGYDYSAELFSLSVNKTAGVFFEAEQPKVRLKIENPFKKKLTLALKSSVYGNDNSVVWSKSEQLVLNVKETYITSIAVDTALPYGCYTFKLELTDENSNTFAKSVDFAVAVENIESNEWLSTTYHLGDNPKYEDVSKNIELSAKAGFSRNRDDIRWSRCETIAGSIAMPDWQEKIFSEEKNSGEKSPIMILNIINFLYTGNLVPHAYDATGCAQHINCSSTTTGKYTLKQQIVAYGRFCAAMATKYKGTKPIFEIGNEPDITRSFKGWNEEKYVDFSGADYAEILKKAYTEIKKVDPEATVISAGLCAYANDNTKGFGEEFLAVEGITNYMDGFSLHPYTYTVNDYGDEISRANAAFFTQLDDAKAELDAAMKRDGTSGIGLYLTEVGSQAEDERKQAVADVRTLVMSQAEPTVEMVNVYNFVSKGTDLTAGENRYGIVRKNYAGVKPSYVAVSNMNKRLAGAKFKDGQYEREYSGTRNFSAYGFERETDYTRQYTYVVWGHTGKSANLTIKKGSTGAKASIASGEQPVITVASDADVKVYDMLGNELAQSSSYTLTDEPVYVVATTQEQHDTKMTVDGNIIRVSGVAKAPGENVTLLAVKENSLTPSYVSIQQSKANSFGEYSFKFELPKSDDKYSVYVYDGEAKGLAGRNAPYTDIKIQYIVNGVTSDTLGIVEAEDDVKAKITMNRTEDNSSNLTFYGTVWGSSGEMISVSAEQVKWNGSTGEAVVDLKNLSDKAKLLLWDEILKPITPECELQQ